MNFSSLRNKQKQGGMALYIVIAVILMLITYVEFAIVEYQDALPLGRSAILFWLVALSVVKYVLVVWIFMHLKDDQKLLTGLFSVGMLIGGGTVGALLLAFTVFNVSKVQRSPYLPTTNYSRVTYDRMGIAEFDASRAVNALDNPAPKNQVFSVAPYQAPDSSTLDLPQLNLAVPNFSAEDQPESSYVAETTSSAEAVASDTNGYAGNEASTATVTNTVISDVSETKASTQDATDTTATLAIAAPTVESTTATNITAVATTEPVTTEDVDALLNQVTSLREQLQQLEQALVAQEPNGQATEGTATNNTIVSPPTVSSTAQPIQEVVTNVEPTQTATENITYVAEQVSTTETAPETTATAETTVETETVTTEPTATEPVVTEPIIAEPAATAETEIVAPVEDSSSEASLSYDWDWQSKGEKAYGNNCVSCHQATGEGIVGAFPSIKGHIPHIYNTAGGREYLANLVLYGLQGQITVNGTSYNGVMSGLSYLSDEDLAAILNHELTSWGNADLIEGKFAPIVPEEIAAARANQQTMAQVYELRQTLDLP